jgi:YtkA-like protein
VGVIKHWSRVCGSGVALLLAIVILGADGAAACEVPEGFARLASPQAEIAYRWEPAELKVGRFFAAEVIACRAPDAEPVRTVVLDAQMPAHGHGMNYRPAVAETGPGRFRFTGLMLHMPGTWRLTFGLFQGDRRTRLTREITLKP